VAPLVQHANRCEDKARNNTDEQQMCGRQKICHGRILHVAGRVPRLASYSSRVVRNEPTRELSNVATRKVGLPDSLADRLKQGR
jgi:hypothetical protein